MLMYALMIDETNKALKETNLGITIPNTDLTIPCLEWMDDVVLIETNQNRAQQQLDITNHASLKYHVEYGMNKTKYLRPGKNKTPCQLKLGDKLIEETKKYTYLGDIINEKLNLCDQIKSIEGKV